MAQLVFDIETVGMPLDLSPDPSTSPLPSPQAERARVRPPLSASGRGWGRGLPKGRLSGPQINQLFAEGKYRESRNTARMTCGRRPSSTGAGASF
jgi:hypothetical protein